MKHVGIEVAVKLNVWDPIVPGFMCHFALCGSGAPGHTRWE